MLLPLSYDCMMASAAKEADSERWRNYTHSLRHRSAHVAYFTELPYLPTW